MLQSTMHKAIMAGATELKRFFNGEFTITNKSVGINNPVTEADHAAEKAIFEAIRKDYPDHFLLGEEAGALHTDSTYKWIVDPIDGTINFAHGIPICCVSIGLEHNGALIMGAVYNPLMNEYYFAEKGTGATLNDKKIAVTQQADLATSCLVTGFPYKYLDTPNSPLQVFERLIRKGIAVRRLGSAALDLCWTAAGRFDGFYEHSLQPWDSAAGIIILQEAGGVVTGFNGQPHSVYQPDILATNGHIHVALQQVINGTV
jgi:myo-inositol-1(or 4)-monophosphatase